MKKTILSCLSLLLAATFVSCEKDAMLQDPTELKIQTASSNPYRVSLSEALATGDLFLNEIDSPRTRAHRTPKSVEYYVNRMQTRSGADADTMLYIVNYENDEGFAILGADKRVTPIYGFSNEGNLDLSDTINNKGLALCMENIRRSTAYETYGFGGHWINPNDSNKINIPDPTYPYPTDPDLDDRVITILKRIEPMLEKNVSRWYQEEEFNYYCPQINFYQKGVVGCVPLAAAMIMSYYEWPTSYAGITLDWQMIKAFEITGNYYPGFDIPSSYRCPDSLAQFLAKIGETFNANYYTDNNGNRLTSVDLTTLRIKFPLFGYSNLSESKTFSANNPRDALDNGPIFVSGDSNGSDTAHAWVIDGYLSYSEYWSAIANETHTLYHSYYHCVWGWGGKSNGYFIINDNAVNTQPVTDEFAPKDNTDTPSNENYMNLQFISGFTPIK